MKRNYRKAYTALKKMGVPVLEGGDRGEDTFRISAEDNTDTVWADYYNEYCSEPAYQFGVKREINEVLEANGLFAEWINPGVLAVEES